MGFIKGIFNAVADPRLFFLLACVGLPLGIAVLMAVHFWRVRKDGGISGPL